MKRLIYILILFFSFSCQKEWSCTTIVTDLDMSDQITTTSFKGSSDEAEAYEDEHTNVYSVYSHNLDTTYEITETTNCVPD